MATGIQLLEDKILVRPNAVEMKTPGGIMLPSESKPKQYTSTVVYVGPGKPCGYPGDRLHQAMTVKPGDVVLHQNPGRDYIVDGETLQLMREDDLAGILGSK